MLFLILGFNKIAKPETKNKPQTKSLGNDVEHVTPKKTGKTLSNPESVFLQRHVTRLLSTFKLEDQSDITRTVKAKMLVSWDATAISSLIAFRQMKENVSEPNRMRILHDLDLALEVLLKDVTLGEDLFVQEHSSTKFYHFMLPVLENCFIVLPIVVTAIIGMALWRGIPFWKIFIFVFIISCGWEWSHMYKKALAKRQKIYHDTIPSNCRMSSFWSSFWSSSYNSECLKYHEALTVEPFLEVNPSLAIAETFSKIILHPLEPLGNKLGIFFNNVLKENSYVASFVVLPFSLLILIVLILSMSGYSYSLPFYMGKIETRKRTQSDALDRKKVLELPTQSDAMDNEKVLELLQEIKNIKELVKNIDQEKEACQPKPFALEGPCREESNDDFEKITEDSNGEFEKITKTEFVENIASL